ncbi:MAG: hypothetical protein Q8R37_00765 [Nanoarchaeota archaeon]|nr:hypothetical protein [Nanoarchaeota archaeon]
MKLLGINVADTILLGGIVVIALLFIFLILLFWRRRKKALRQSPVSLRLENALSELSLWKQKPILPLDRELVQVQEELQRLPQMDIPVVKRITRVRPR